MIKNFQRSVCKPVIAAAAATLLATTGCTDQEASEQVADDQEKFEECIEWYRNQGALSLLGHGEMRDVTFVSKEVLIPSENLSRHRDEAAYQITYRDNRTGETSKFMCGW